MNSITRETQFFSVEPKLSNILKLYMAAFFESKNCIT